MKIGRTGTIIIFSGIFLLLALGFSYDISDSKRICIEENCFYIEIAETDEEKAQGLMFRDDLKKDEGMLFIYEEEGNYSFWMRDTLIPLDIIWMDIDGVIVHIENNLQPCEEDPCKIYHSSKDAGLVLEINGNLSRELNISIGKKLK